MTWIPPGKNCGACGMNSCKAFMQEILNGTKESSDCPYYPGSNNGFNDSALKFINEDKADHIGCNTEYAEYTGYDICNAQYDFVITSLPGEPSARKIVLPFRPDLVEKFDVRAGDIVTGRPTGAGCPVQHVIRVLEADPITGVITGHVVGPAFSRNNPNVIDLKMYHMIGFEGIAKVIHKAPQFGIRHSFLPGVCMMHRAHTGVVNLVMKKSYGIHVRVEGVVIL